VIRPIEDLAIVAAQLAGLMRDTAALVWPAPPPFPDVTFGAGYWPGVYSATALLRRAEGQLAEIGRDSGASPALPAFDAWSALDLPTETAALLRSTPHALATRAGAGPATTVFIRTAIVRQVRAVEAALAAADRTASLAQTRAALIAGVPAILDQQAGAIALAGAGFALLAPPQSGDHTGQQMTRLLEDLTVYSNQVAAVLWETAKESRGRQGSADRLWAAYWLGVDRALDLLRRAEGWLETIDRETGARTRLPGFEPGTVLDDQLDLQ
jgi:hypothetical protein